MVRITCSAKSLLTTFSVFFAVTTGSAYSSELFSGKGYLSFLQTVAAQNRDAPWLIEGNLHNRLEGTWQPLRNFSLNGALRTRLL